MKLVVGLGNPGPRYAGTRHNVGFEVIDGLVQGSSAASPRERFDAWTYELREGPETILLMKPMTYMNLSGRAVRAAVDFYKLPLENLLVVCDDFNLPLGQLRLRAKGSHGGQNGLRDIQQQLGTDHYPRLRIGVGQPAPGDAVDFVLTRFKADERRVIDEALARAVQAVLTWCRDGIAAAMNRFNAAEESTSPRRKTPEAQPRPDPPRPG